MPKTALSQTRELDFEALTLRDALDLAVLIEEEARDRYEELAAQLLLHRTPEAAGFFTKMVRIEEHHRQQLLAQREKAFGQQPVHVRREWLFDIEAPAYDEARMHMTLRAALQTALRSEVKAHRFFDSALRSVLNPEVRRLFEALREEEVEHQRLVQAELEKLPAQTAAEQLQLEDDPVAQ